MQKDSPRTVRGANNIVFKNTENVFLHTPVCRLLNDLSGMFLGVLKRALKFIFFTGRDKKRNLWISKRNGFFNNFLFINNPVIVKTFFVKKTSVL